MIPKGENKMRYSVHREDLLDLKHTHFICACEDEEQARTLARLLCRTLWQGFEVYVYDENTRIMAFVQSRDRIHQMH